MSECRTSSGSSSCGSLVIASVGALGPTGGRLHSHGINYPVGNRQPQVTCHDGNNDCEYRIVLHGRTGEVGPGGMLSDGMTIRLEEILPQRKSSERIFMSKSLNSSSVRACAGAGQFLFIESPITSPSLSEVIASVGALGPTSFLAHQCNDSPRRRAWMHGMSWGRRSSSPGTCGSPPTLQMDRF